MAITPTDTHEWISFEDDEEERTWMFDATFLTSNWTCIFGNGCQGVLTGPAPELVQGCCSYGAHLVNKKDARRVEKAAGCAHRPVFKVVQRGRQGAGAQQLGEGRDFVLGKRSFDFAPVPDGALDARRTSRTRPPSTTAMLRPTFALV